MGTSVNNHRLSPSSPPNRNPASNPELSTKPPIPWTTATRNPEFSTKLSIPWTTAPKTPSSPPNCPFRGQPPQKPRALHQTAISVEKRKRFGATASNRFISRDKFKNYFKRSSRSFLRDASSTIFPSTSSPSAMMNAAGTAARLYRDT